MRAQRFLQIFAQIKALIQACASICANKSENSVGNQARFLYDNFRDEKKVDVPPKVKQGGVGPIAKSLSPISEPIMDEDED